MTSSRLPLDAHLRDRSRVRRVGAPALPIPAWARFDDFVDAANAAGAETNRHELLAAWICTASPSARELRKRVERYRSMTVRDVAPSGRAGSKYATFAVRTAGRPVGR